MNQHAHANGSDGHHTEHDHDHVHGPDCNHAHQEPVRNTLKDIGRNDPCPCGSQKKFKKCHGV